MDRYVPDPSSRISRVERIIADRRRRKMNALSPARWYPGMHCWICWSPITREQRFNFDHKIPMSQGGARGRRNKAYTHVLCNTVKGDRYPFFLRTPAERDAVRQSIRPDLFERLQRLWSGEPDDQVSM